MFFCFFVFLNEAAVQGHSEDTSSILGAENAENAE